MKAYFRENKLYHIGDWDYMIEKDQKENEIIMNPFPNDLVERDVEIEFNQNGIPFVVEK
jgi:hypothetical protein